MTDAQGAHLDRTRAYNRRIVFAALRRDRASSRTELARRTGLSLPTVSSLIDELERDGWVASRGRRSTPRGQPPREYELRPDGAYGIGVAFDADHVVAEAVDLAGGVVHRAYDDGPVRDPDEALPRIAALVEQARAGLPARRRKALLGVGIGVPGVVDESGRVVRMVRIPAFEDRPLGPDLAERTGLNVTVVNDAVAAAVGEAAFRSERRQETFFYALFALGLGSAFVLDGRPYRGLFDATGRFGHIPVMPDGPRCPSCGGRGCLSLHASLASLRRRLRAARGGAAPEASDWHADHPVVAAWTEEASLAFARGLLVLENLLAPGAVVLDGRLPAAILDALADRVRSRYLELRPARPERAWIDVRVGARGDRAVAYGAASVPLHLATAPDLAWPG